MQTWRETGNSARATNVEGGSEGEGEGDDIKMYESTHCSQARTGSWQLVDSVDDEIWPHSEVRHPEVHVTSHHLSPGELGYFGRRLVGDGLMHFTPYTLHRSLMTYLQRQFNPEH